MIGQELIFSTWEEINLMCFTLNALAFRAIDVDPDDRILLDGSEYEAAPKSVFFPGFLGQDFPNSFQPAAESLVILTSRARWRMGLPSRPRRRAVRAVWVSRRRRVAQGKMTKSIKPSSGTAPRKTGRPAA